MTLNLPKSHTLLSLFALAWALTANAGGGQPNDECTGATMNLLNIGSPLVLTGDNTGSTDTEGLGLPSVWESFSINTCMDITIAFCGTSPAFSAVSASLFEGCPWENYARTAQQNSVDCGDGNRTLVFPQMPAGTYYYAVLASMGATGPYTLTITGASCATPAPANDACANALVLTPGATCTYTTVNTAGATGSFPAVACNGFTGNGSDEVWFSFQTGQSDPVIQVDGSANYDAVVELYGGNCGSPTFIDCADNTTAGGIETLQAQNLIVGGIYLVRVYDWFAGQPITTTIDICVMGTPSNAPANDICSNVLVEPLGIGDTLHFSGDNTNATNDAVPGSPLDGSDPMVWHAFSTVDCAHVTIDYCNSPSVFSDHYVLLSGDCPSSAITFSSGFDLNTCANGQMTIRFDSLPAGDYWIPILQNVGSTGAYAIRVSAATCAPIPPLNDDCNAAQTLVLHASGECPGNASMGSLYGATMDTIAPTCLADSLAFVDVWYTFQTNGDTVVSLDLVAPAPSTYGVEVLTSCGGTSLFCDSSATDTSIQVPANTTLVLRVFTVNASTDTSIFSICLYTDSIVPFCDGGNVSTVDSMTQLVVCLDGQPDLIDLVSNTTSLGSLAFLLTNENDQLINILPGNSIDLEGSPPGTYHLWAFSYYGSITGATPGTSVFSLGSSGSCHALSNNFIIAEVEVCTGVQENTAVNSEWPVAFLGTGIRVWHSGTSGAAQMTVWDPAGRALFDRQVQLSTDGRTDIPWNAPLTPGIHLVRFGQGGAWYITRVAMVPRASY